MTKCGGEASTKNSAPPRLHVICNLQDLSEIPERRYHFRVCIALERHNQVLHVIQRHPLPPPEFGRVVRVDFYIGIGAGKYCDGQVLVLQDMLGIYAGKSPRFVRNFMQGVSSIEQAISDYVAAVKAQTFPDTEHSFE